LSNLENVVNENNTYSQHQIFRNMY
jgi:hypothetical protein